MTPGQELAIEQLREIESVGDDALEILSTKLIGKNPKWVQVEVSVYCGDMEGSPGGLPLRTRERCFLYILPDFPFEIPSVWTGHTRFAGYPHVQWKRHLCLYQAPQTEWDPSDGIFGFVRRLDEWLRQGARDQLDPIGAPLHPPVAYPPRKDLPIVIPRANTPDVREQNWFGAAHLETVSDRRVDVCGWSPVLAPETPRNVAAAILLSKPMPFEFPTKVGGLIRELESHGVPRRMLLLTLQLAVLRNDEAAPLYVLIGAPMRGVRGSGDLRQHLTAWFIEPMIAKGLRLAINKYEKHEKLKELGEEVERIVLDWAEGAEAAWCRVYEDRPEIVVRRDHDAIVSWFRGRKVSLWGCGALGGYVAEFLTRAGVGKLILRDSDIVTPGVLVRQSFGDGDVGRLKAEVLSRRLQEIRPDLPVEWRTQNLLREPLGDTDWTDGADVVIDTTASETVIEKLESVRRLHKIAPIPAISMVVGHRAERGLVVLSQPRHSGGPFDVIRRAKMTACDSPVLRAYADEFWPEGRQPEFFQPEPGCSDPTFVGSAADVAGLASMMLNQVSSDLAAETRHTAFAHFISQPHVDRDPPSASFSWEPDEVTNDPHTGYEIRIASSAWSEITDWILDSRKKFGPRVETGGVLFGERNEALRVIWISEVIGPPSDSEASEAGFVCGVVGTAEANDEKRKRSRRSVQCIGVWHTHPKLDPLPSTKDLDGMVRIVTAVDPPSPKSLLLIVGGKTSKPFVGTFLFTRTELQNIESGIYLRRCAVKIVGKQETSGKSRLSLSGVLPRTLAFCTHHLKALKEVFRRTFTG